MNISTKDLNLLIIFKTLFEDLNVSRAAKRLAMSQPAISHALSRLREDFQDPLFVRVSRGMVPTKVATEMAPRVLEVVRSAEGLYGSKVAFDSASLTGRFQITTTEFIEQILGARLVARLMQEAPKLQVVFRPTTGIFPARELERGSLDLAIAGFFAKVPDGFIRQKIMTDTYSCIVRRGHPAVVGGKISLKTYSTLTHVLTSPQGDLWGAADQALKIKKMQRRVQAGFSSFFAPGWVVETSDAILTTPSRIAAVFAKHLQVECYPVPVEIPEITVYQVWHQRSQDDAGHAWLRGVVREIASS